MVRFATRLSRAMLAAALVMGSVGIQPAAAVTAETVAVVNHGPTWFSGPQIEVLHQPTATLFTSSQPGSGGANTFATVDFTAAWGTQIVSASLYPPAGSDLIVGQTYTHVKYFWDPTATSADYRNTVCADATTTVLELQRDAGGSVTTLAWNVTCGGAAAGSGYAFRWNSTIGYATGVEFTPYFGPAIFPGETAHADYTITSSGTVPLHVASVALEDGGNGISIENDQCSGQTIAVGASCTVALQAIPPSPTGPGDVLVVSSDSVGGAFRRPFNLDVKDPISMSAPAVDLGSAVATNWTASKTITVTNDGVIPAPITSILLADATTGWASAFAVTGETCTAHALAAGGSCTIQVRAKPPLIGAGSAELFISGNDPVIVHSVALGATGTDPLTWTPDGDLYLPITRPGATSDGQIVVHSAATIYLPGFTTSWIDGEPSLSVSDNGCAGGIPAGGSCTVHVHFQAPPLTGTYEPTYRSDWLRILGASPLATGRVPRIFGSVSLPSSGVAFVGRSSQSPRWNFGNALARAISGSTVALLQVASSDRVGSSLVTDTGTKLPVYVSRSTNSGTSWAAPVRVNPSSQHGMWPVIAAAGPDVHVAWVQTARVVDFNNTAPRVLYVRSNRSTGSGSWGTIHRLTSTTGRVDHPAIAASGAVVAVVWTDSVTGAVRLAVSQDHGVTWRTMTVGSTTLAATWGKTALASVGVDGQTIAVSWLSDVDGTVRARTSTTTGTSWSPITKLGTDAVDGPSVAVAGPRVGVVWSDGVGPLFRLLSRGRWNATRVVPAPKNALGYNGPYQFAVAPALVLSGTSRVGVAFADCYRDCFTFTGDTAGDVIWAESSTSGATWTEPVRVAEGAGAQSMMDDPSVVQPSATQRFVLVNACCASAELILAVGTSSGPVPMAPSGEPRSAADPSWSLRRDWVAPLGFAGPLGRR